VHFDDIACIVADPKVTIKPGFKPKFFIPELDKTKPRWNQIVYRVYDIASQTQTASFGRQLILRYSRQTNIE
jgi:hypothetical protein